MHAHEPPSAPVRAFMAPAALDAASAFWVRFLDAMDGLPAVRANHRRRVDLLGLRAGSALLDVGCGTGSFARAVAPIVGPAGRVVGLDRSATMLAVATARAVATGLSIAYLLGDAAALPFAAASFDAAQTERVLQYLDDPGRAVAELMRVTTPGGRVAATEADWDGISVDCGAVDRGIYRRALAWISDSVGNGWQGRQTRRLFVDAGLEEIVCEGVIVIVTDARTALEDLAARVSVERARDAGAITAAEAEQLIAAVWELDRTGRCTVGIPLYTVAGRVPRGRGGAG